MNRAEQSSNLALDAYIATGVEQLNRIQSSSDGNRTFQARVEEAYQGWLSVVDARAKAGAHTAAILLQKEPDSDRHEILALARELFTADGYGFEAFEGTCADSGDPIYGALVSWPWAASKLP